MSNVNQKALKFQNLKIAIRFPNWLGDLVMSIGFYNKVKEVFKDAKIYAIVKVRLVSYWAYLGILRKFMSFQNLNIMEFLEYIIGKKK